jgi:AraC-like DNA-binding protein
MGMMGLGSLSETRLDFGLAEMGPGYREVAPPPLVRQFVACFWVREAQQGDRHARVVPDGCIDIIWRGDGDIVVAGPATRAIIAGSWPSAGYVGVRFLPGIASSLLRVSADELLDRHVPLASILPKETRELLERADGAANAVTRLGLLQVLLTSRLTAPFAADEAVRVSVTMLRRHASPNVRDLSDALSISERQLLRRFRTAVGYGPKTLDRVLRFQRALSFIRSPAPTLKLVDVALQSGYADQAHMIREFVQLSGLPPARLARLPASPMSDSFKKYDRPLTYDHFRTAHGGAAIRQGINGGSV